MIKNKQIKQIVEQAPIIRKVAKIEWNTADHRRYYRQEILEGHVILSCKKQNRLLEAAENQWDK